MYLITCPNLNGIPIPVCIDTYTSTQITMIYASEIKVPIRWEKKDFSCIDLQNMDWIQSLVVSLKQ